MGLGIGGAYGIVRPHLDEVSLSLAGLSLALAAMVGSDVPTAALGVVDPARGPPSTWVMDFGFHLPYVGRGVLRGIGRESRRRRGPRGHRRLADRGRDRLRGRAPKARPPGRRRARRRCADGPIASFQEPGQEQAELGLGYVAYHEAGGSVSSWWSNSWAPLYEEGVCISYGPWE